MILMKWKSFERASKKYLADLDYGRSQGTLRALRVALKRFLGYVDDDPRLFDDNLYMEWFRSLKLAPSTIKHTHRIVVRFLKWMEHKTWKKADLIRYEAPLPPIKTYSGEEMRAILEWCNKQKEGGWKMRAAAFLMVLASSGMRGGEAILLRWEDFNPLDCSFHLTKTKTRRSRFAALHPGVVDYLKKYRRSMRDRVELETPWVFPSLINPMNHVAYNAIMSNVRNRVSKTIGVPINAKKFRSTLVMRVVESPLGDYEKAAAIVGHRDIGVTQRHYHRIKIGNEARTAHLDALGDLKF